jgi:hypothetical protein
VETIARLAVLLSCAAATGGLLVILARPHPAGGNVRVEGPGSLPGIVPAALAGYVLLAGGAALTGAGTLDAGVLAAGLRVGGIGLLAATCLLAGTIGAPSGPRVPLTLGGLVILLWAAGALALLSWLLAIGAVLVALVGSVRVGPDR